MVRFFLSLILLFAISCSTQKLPESWFPLTTVVERGNIPGVGDGVVTTISPYLYTSDLDWFNERYPEGSIDHNSLRVHELQHALEQEAYVDGATGTIRATRLSDWIRKYLTSKSFRWEVEKRAYKVDILYKRKFGVTVNPEFLAKILSGNTYNGMISYEEALEWVRDVLNERA